MASPGDSIGIWTLDNLVKERGDFDFWAAHNGASGVPVELLLARETADPARVLRCIRAHAYIKDSNCDGFQRVAAYFAGDPFSYVALDARGSSSLQDVVSAGGPLDNAELMLLALNLGRAFEALNAKSEIALRSLKPSNVLMEEGGGVTVCDFTLAVMPGIRGMEAAIDGDGLVGTPNYMSPEQASGGIIGTASDMHALGLTLYFAATGKTPFADRGAAEILDAARSGTLPDPLALNRRLDSRLVRLMSALTAKDPERRYPSWRLFVADAEAVSFGGSPKFSPPSGTSATIPGPVAAPSAPSAAKAGYGDARDASAPSAATRAFHALLWLALAAWLAILANWRVGNPAGLPGFASLKSLDFAEELANAGLSSPESADGEIQDAGKSDEWDTPEDNARTQHPQEPPAQHPQAMPGTGASRHDARYVKEPQARDAVAPATQVQPMPPQSDETPLSAWGQQVEDSLRRGDFAGAAAIAESSRSAFGLQIASILRSIPPIDEAVAEEIARRSGQHVTLMFNGKARYVVPVSCSGTAFTVEYSGRNVTVDASRLANTEKARWLEYSTNDAQLMLAASLALAENDRVALARIARKSATLGRLFQR